MALPGFYNQGDQDIYASGDKFIPQEQYRLGYTAPPSIANASTGITNTQAASPYKWPPQGGGGGAVDNPFGPNAITKDFDVRSWDGTKYVDKTITGYQTGSGWKTEKNKNIFHAGIGKTDENRNIGDIEETEMDFSKLRNLSPLNFITTKLRNWKKNRDIKKAQEESTDAAAATGPRWRTEGGGQGTPGAGGENVRSSSGDVYGGAALGYNEAAEKSDYYKHGGRIGYKWGSSDPEEPAEDIREIMQDQNIPFSEQVEGDPFQMRIQELMGKGLSYDDAYDIAEMEFQDLFAEGSEQDQGIASLV